MREDESEFWKFSLTVYGDPDVQEECLNLQDEYGIDVNLLLFCAFAGAVHGAVLSDQAMKEATDTVRRWHDDVVSPLRAARRALKPVATDGSPIAAAAGNLRSQVKMMELEAERIEQALLERWSAAHFDAWPRARPVGAVADNIRTFFAISAGKPRRPGLPSHLVAAALAVARH